MWKVGLQPLLVVVLVVKGQGQAMWGSRVSSSNKGARLQPLHLDTCKPKMRARAAAVTALAPCFALLPSSCPPCLRRAGNRLLRRTGLKDPKGKGKETVTRLGRVHQLHPMLARQPSLLAPVLRPLDPSPHVCLLLQHPN